VKRLFVSFLIFLFLGIITISVGVVLVSIFSRLTHLLMDGEWPLYSISDFSNDFKFSFFNGSVFGSLMFLVNLFLKKERGR